MQYIAEPPPEYEPVRSPCGPYGKAGAGGLLPPPPGAQSSAASAPPSAVVTPSQPGGRMGSTSLEAFFAPYAEGMPVAVHPMINSGSISVGSGQHSAVQPAAPQSAIIQSVSTQPVTICPVPVQPVASQPCSVQAIPVQPRIQLLHEASGVQPQAGALPDQLLSVTPPVSPTLSQRSHRRIVSDTSAFVKPFAQETSQFLAPFEASHGRPSSPGGEAILPDENVPRPHHWNPFAESSSAEQINEDHLFGQEFDRIRRGSQSSISNVKSRESLVMSSGDLTVDPFGAAPFGRSGKNSHGRSRSSGPPVPPQLLAAPVPVLPGGAAHEESVTYVPLCDEGSNGAIELRMQQCSDTSSASYEGSQSGRSGMEAYGASPFVRAPPEDRSKYEKLLDDVEEDFVKLHPNHDPHNALPEEDKDSIGSASDLRAMVDLSEEEEVGASNCVEATDPHVSDDRFPASEDGSAEVAVEERLGYQDVFMGHTDGDKPLLEDDQLSDTEQKHVAGEVKLGAKNVANRQPPVPPKPLDVRQTEGGHPPKIPLPSPEGADVFMKAPFHRPKPPRRPQPQPQPATTVPVPSLVPRPVFIAQSSEHQGYGTTDYQSLPPHPNSDADQQWGIPKPPCTFPSISFVRNSSTSDTRPLPCRVASTVIVERTTPPTRTRSHQDLFGSKPFASGNGTNLTAQLPIKEALPRCGSPVGPEGPDDGDDGGLRKFKKDKRRYQQLKAEEDPMTEDLVDGRRLSHVRTTSRRDRRKTEKMSNAFSNLSFEDIGSEEDGLQSSIDTSFRTSPVGK